MSLHDPNINNGCGFGRGYGCICGDNKARILERYDRIQATLRAATETAPRREVVRSHYCQATIRKATSVDPEETCGEEIPCPFHSWRRDGGDDDYDPIEELEREEDRERQRDDVYMSGGDDDD